MPNELIQIQTPRALAASEGDLDAIKEAIATNFNGAGVSDWDLMRVKISGGANPLWILPTLEGEQMLSSITCNIVFTDDTRVYHAAPFGKSAGKPPDCLSGDGITGKGSPGGECSRCPLAAYGSAEEGSGQACKQVKRLFIICGGFLMPILVSLPPTSLKSARQLLLKLTAQGIPYDQALVNLELEKAQNAAGIQYGRVVMKFIRRLEPEEAARARQYHELCRTLAARVPTGLDPEIRDQSADANS
jgi:hypothetical protein